MRDREPDRDAIPLDIEPSVVAYVAVDHGAPDLRTREADHAKVGCHNNLFGLAIRCSSPRPSGYVPISKRAYLTFAGNVHAANL